MSDKQKTYSRILFHHAAYYLPLLPPIPPPKKNSGFEQIPLAVSARIGVHPGPSAHPGGYVNGFFRYHLISLSLVHLNLKVTVRSRFVSLKYLMNYVSSRVEFYFDFGNLSSYFDRDLDHSGSDASF